MVGSCKQPVRVFKNPILEKLTHVHPLTPLILWLPIAGWLFWQSRMELYLSYAEIFSWGGLGLVTWTLAEYLLHRFVFHYEGNSTFSKKMYFVIHGLHHADPLDPTRLVMPPAASVIFGTLLYALFYQLFGPVFVQPFFSFFLVGYLCYDYIHFAVHYFPLRTKMGCLLRSHHMKHHHVTPHARWGVSSPFWDYVFGTFEEVKKKDREIIRS